MSWVVPFFSMEDRLVLIAHVEIDQFDDFLCGKKQ